MSSTPLLPPSRSYAVVGWGRNCHPRGLPWKSGGVWSTCGFDGEDCSASHCSETSPLPTSPWAWPPVFVEGSLRPYLRVTLPGCVRVTAAGCPQRLLRLPHGLTLRLLRSDDTATDRLGCPMSIWCLGAYGCSARTCPAAAVLRCSCHAPFRLPGRRPSSPLQGFGA